ncbi:MAG: biopolymer transporter ExbD [Myxococcota bacterium]
MGAQLGSDGAMNEINMTPLIDIVLVVLIIMMVNMPIEVQELGVKLPNPNATPPPPTEDRPDQLMIAVYADERIALNRILMTEPKLREQLTRRLIGLKKKNVFVDAHPDVPLRLVTDMVDVARESGAEQVGFAKLKDDGPLEPTGSSQGAMPRDVIAGNPTVTQLKEEEEALDNVVAYSQIQKVLPQIRGCYFQALALDPALTGNYLLEITIGPDGQQMEEPKILTDSLKDPKVADCTMQLLPSITYPAIGYQNTAVVRYPLLFSPG